MKNKKITEMVRLEVLPSVSDEQLISKVNLINEFLRVQDGFIDAELIKSTEGSVWYLIYHIENMEKLRAVGEKLRSNKLFESLNPLVVPGSVTFSFFNQVCFW